MLHKLVDSAWLCCAAIAIRGPEPRTVCHFPLNLTLSHHISVVMVSQSPPLHLLHTPQEWEISQAWLGDTDTYPFCSSCAHSKTYWHVVSVFLIMRLVPVDKRPIHQAWQVCRAAASPHHLYSLIHPVQSFFCCCFFFVCGTPAHFCLPTFIFRSLLAAFYPKCSYFIYFPSLSSFLSLSCSKECLLVSALVTVCSFFLMFLPSWHRPCRTEAQI